MANISTFVLGRRALFAGLMALAYSASAADNQPGTQKSAPPLQGRTAS